MPKALKARGESEMALSVGVMSIAPIHEEARMKSPYSQKNAGGQRGHRLQCLRSERDQRGRSLGPQPHQGGQTMRQILSGQAQGMVNPESKRRGGHCGSPS